MTSVADAGADVASSDSSTVDAESDAPSTPDASEDLSVADASIDVPSTPDATVEEDSGFPCLTDGGGVDWDCCTAMGFPPGCPVIGPFAPPSMDA